MSQEEKLIKIEKNELTIYNDKKVSPETLAECLIEIKKAFPRLNDGWFDVMERLLDVEGFTDQRLVDATIAMIRNCEFPEPTIAKLIGFDRTIKVFTYNELLEKTKEYGPQMRAEFLNSYSRIDFYGQLRYAKKEDVEKHNLKKWK